MLFFVFGNRKFLEVGAHREAASLSFKPLFVAPPPLIKEKHPGTLNYNSRSSQSMLYPVAKTT